MDKGGETKKNTETEKETETETEGRDKELMYNTTTLETAERERKIEKERDNSPILQKLETGCLSRIKLEKFAARRKTFFE